VIVLGIDPGTAVTGFGVVSAGDAAPARQSRQTPVTTRMRLVECGVIRTRPGDALASRLRDIYDGVGELIERHHPDYLAVEDVFYSRNVRTTLVLGHARGVVLLAGVEAGVPIREYPPTEIKKAVVGTGAATKDQVQFMLTRLLHLRSAPHPADAADGVAAALTCVMTAHLDRVREAAAGMSGATGVGSRSVGRASTPGKTERDRRRNELGRR
jgi:crossover junction endodeoxyribonuclease RuvC